MSFCRNVSIGFALAITLITAGCASTALKEENAALKQQLSQDEQTLKDYADKLTAANKLSEEEKSRAESELAAMRRDLNNVLQENQVHVKKLEDLTVVEIKQSVLFKSGQAELSKEGKAIVTEIANTFSQYSGYHMRIEGHTDNMPIHEKLKQRYYSNWELSAARATTVVRYMVSALKVPAKNLSIAGYADNRPVASNDTKEGRAQNRRIRAVIYRI